MSTNNPVHQAPRLSARPFSISGSQDPFFHFPEGSVQKMLPYLLKVPPLGFGYPFDGVSPQNPRKLLSAPNALGLRSSELFSSKMARMKSPSPVPLRRLGQTVQPVSPALQRCQLISKAVSPFLRPGGLARVGTLALLSFGPLGRSLHSGWIQGVSPRISPLVSFNTATLRSQCRGTSGSATGAAWPSPPVGGAGPSGLPHRLSSATS